MDELLEELRSKAFAIAYRMLGTVSDAEDIAQESLIRVHRALDAGERLASPTAYVATIATRLAIDHLRSARVRREQYTGEWLPTPIQTEVVNAGQATELAESLSLAFLLVLERLSPEQRAVFLLRDVFDYPYGAIADIIGKSEAATRQLAVRARRHVQDARPRFDVSPAQRAQLADRFFAATRDGDLAALEALLAEDVVLLGDGGGKVPAITRPVRGRIRVASTLLTWARIGFRAGGSISATQINGQPGALSRDAHGSVVGALALHIVDGRIQTVHSIVNPEKLAHFGGVGDLASMLRSGGREGSGDGS